MRLNNIVEIWHSCFYSENRRAKAWATRSITRAMFMRSNNRASKLESILGFALEPGRIPILPCLRAYLSG